MASSQISISGSENVSEIRTRNKTDSSNSSIGWNCPQCGKKLKSSFSLKCLLQTHLPEAERPKFKCSSDGCEKEYNFRNRLTSHLQTHLPDGQRNKLKCSVDGCHKEFYYRHYLKLHVQKIHLGTFQKIGCGFCTSTSTFMVDHRSC